MTPDDSVDQRNFILKVMLSSDEPRLRAGWRLLLHTIILGLISSSLILIYFFVPGLALDGFSDVSPITLILEFGSIVAATWVARRFFDRRSFRSLGFNVTKHTWADLAVGFLLPGLLIGLIFVVEMLFGWITLDGWIWQVETPVDGLIGIVSGLIAFTLVGFSEEILSRGYHLQNLKDGLNLRWALLLSSGIFALLHISNPHTSWFSVIGILFAGYFMAYGWIRTGQLWLSIGLHIGWNFFEGNIFGFPVSGLSTTRLIIHHSTGPEWITGGAFGPEAGFIILPAMALGVFIMRQYTERVQRSAQP